MITISVTMNKKDQTIAVCGLSKHSEDLLKKRLEKSLWSDEDYKVFLSYGIKRIEKNQVNRVSLH